MAKQTRDELAAEILRDSKTWAPRTPRALARNEVDSTFRAAQDAIPERERILTNARKHTHEDYVAGWREQRTIASKGNKLTEDEKDELQRLRHLWGGLDCPYAQPPEVKVTLAGEGIPHLDAFVQEWLWNNHWWAAYAGQTIEEYLERCLKTDLYGPLSMAAVRNSPPMPEGYVVSTRR